VAVYIYKELQFKKRLEDLKKAGGKSALVAARTEEIISRYASGNRLLPERTKTITKYGDARIPNSRKFNLGSGYRLISMRKGEDIIFLCVGPHDFCNCWIENNKGLDPDMESDCSPVRPIPSPISRRMTQGPEPETDYDRLLMSLIDERILKRIFCGLTGAGSQ
jgi:hypothetical protein